jgi:hypothetical protein
MTVGELFETIGNTLADGRHYVWRSIVDFNLSIVGNWIILLLGAGAMFVIPAVILNTLGKREEAKKLERRTFLYFRPHHPAVPPEGIYYNAGVVRAFGTEWIRGELIQPSGHRSPSVDFQRKEVIPLDEMEARNLITELTGMYSYQPERWGPSA